jgi:hypothetical protein
MIQLTFLKKHDKSLSQLNLNVQKYKKYGIMMLTYSLLIYNKIKIFVLRIVFFILSYPNKE